MEEGGRREGGREGGRERMWEGGRRREGVCSLDFLSFGHTLSLSLLSLPHQLKFVRTQAANTTTHCTLETSQSA